VELLYIHITKMTKYVNATHRWSVLLLVCFLSK